MVLSPSRFKKEKLFLFPKCRCLESKLKISEEDLGPVVRQRSNTLPKSFGSQLEKEDDKKQDLSDKSAKPAVEVTLDSIQKKLQEKRTETNRPEDIKVQYMQIRFRPFKYKHVTHSCTVSCESLLIFCILYKHLQPLLQAYLL